MRLLILKDQSLPPALYAESVKQLKLIYREAGIPMTITDEPYYFGDPKKKPHAGMWEIYYHDSRGRPFWGMKQVLLNHTVKEIDMRYGKKFDHIMFAVDRRNWFADQGETKVWGWNISAGIHGYDVQQVRVDTTSKRFETQVANTLGAMYHELMHSHMHYPYRVFNGARIERNLRQRGYSTHHWGNEVVHGEGKEWAYIRHRENIEALKVVAPVLNACYQTRKVQHEEGMSVADALNESYRRVVLQVTVPFAEPYVG